MRLAPLLTLVLLDLRGHGDSGRDRVVRDVLEWPEARARADGAGAQP